MSVRIGIDIGGTFTDVVALGDDGRLVRYKVSSTPRAPHEGFLAALDLVVRDVAVEAIALIAHASTIATNALLGQMHLELPRVAFLTTDGFRDVLEIGRQNRSALYDLNVVRPRPLAARNDRFPIRERLAADGSVALPLEPARVHAAIAAIGERGITAVAIGFLHSDVNDAHERAAAELIAAALPDVALSLSSVVDPQYREYERFSTTVVNAALGPIVRDYLDRLTDGVRARAVAAPIFVMRSDGGMASLAAAGRQPAALIESGPASGVIGAAYLGRALGLRNVISFDMGGTTAKAGTIVDGAPEVASEFEAAGSTHSGRAVRGSGYPVRFPFVDLAEVSAGGGTIAWLDTAESLRVGPVSAGADPGPACYGRGDRPTVTDANVVLQRLNPLALLDGAFPIDAARSARAVATVAAPLDGDVARAAAGIVTLVDAEMAKVVRIVSIERGYDPRDFTLVAFGGGGPLHACAVAAEIGIRRIVVPAAPGVFSAYGLLAADVRTSHARSVLAPANDATWRVVRTLLDQLAAEGDRALGEQRVAMAARAFVYEVDLRYAGQSFDLTVPASASLASVLEAFHARHEARYGFRVEAEATEIVTARVIATGTTAKPPLCERVADATRSLSGARRATRSVWDGAAFVDTPVYDRRLLEPGMTFAGPAVVEQYDATTYVAPGWTARLDGYDDLVLEYA